MKGIDGLLQNSVGFRHEHIGCITGAVDEGTPEAPGMTEAISVNPW